MKKIELHCGCYLTMRRAATEAMTVMTQGFETPAEMSERGRQLLKEWDGGSEEVKRFTNNDHVLNGLRVAIMEAEYDAVPDWITIHFWPKGLEQVVITVNQYGRLSKWPVGFFDQIENDLCKLISAPRKK